MMDDDRKTVETHPHPLTKAQPEGGRIVGREQGREEVATTDVHHALPRDPASGHTHQVSTKTVISTAGGMTVVQVKIDGMGLDLRTQPVPSPQVQTLDTIPAHQGSDTLPARGGELHLRV